jgi:hypothetical protein
MKTTLTAAAVAAFAIIGGIFGIAAPAQAQTNTPDTATPGMSMDMGGGDMMTMMREMMANHKWGMISSIQNNEQGQPAWIVAGHWMLEMASQNDTATPDTTGGISNIVGFNAMLHMVMLNGSATMREGPVQDVQTTIEIAQDKVIAISPDPAALENHFGDTPIYGIVVSPEMIEQMMMSDGDMGGMMNSSGGM